MTEIPKWRDAEGNVDWDAAGDELKQKVADAEADWRQPWMTDEWLTWWKGLDHAGCSQYIDGVEFEVVKLLPGYVMCHSMHCPDCGKSCGGQGHYNCPVREAKKKEAAEVANNAWVDDLVGMTEAGAYAAAKEEGFYARVVKRNGSALVVTRDYRPEDRVNLDVQDYVVVAARVG